MTDHKSRRPLTILIALLVIATVAFFAWRVVVGMGEEQVLAALARLLMRFLHLPELDII